MSIAVAEVHAPHLLRRALAVPTLLVGVGLIVIGFVTRPDFFDPFTAAGSGIVVAAAVSARFRWGAWGALAILAGELSYAFYLWHADVISAFARVLTKPGDAVVPAFVAAAAIASLSWVVIERPAIAVGRRLTRRPA
jgi:peptidoglycan/LPS O-acetylase OafA/YrhL